MTYIVSGGALNSTHSLAPLVLAVGWCWPRICTSNQYLGVLLKASRQCKCSFDQTKIKFYHSFNAMCYRAKNASSKLVCVQLLKSICMPVLLYAKFYHLLKQMLLGWIMCSTALSLEFLAVPVLLISVTSVQLLTCHVLPVIHGIQI